MCTAQPAGVKRAQAAIECASFFLRGREYRQIIAGAFLTIMSATESLGKVRAVAPSFECAAPYLPDEGSKRRQLDSSSSLIVMALTEISVC